MQHKEDAAAVAAQAKFIAAVRCRQPERFARIALQLSTLEAHGLDGLVPGHRYVGVVGDLEKPLLGLGEEAFSALAEASRDLS